MENSGSGVGFSALASYLFVSLVLQSMVQRDGASPKYASSVADENVFAYNLCSYVELRFIGVDSRL